MDASFASFSCSDSTSGVRIHTASLPRRLQRRFSRAHVAKEDVTVREEEPSDFTEDALRTIFVGRLDYAVGEDDLRAFLAPFGTVEVVKLVRTKEGKSRGYAFVQFASEEEASIAYDQADARTLLGRRIVVDREKGRTDPTWKPRRAGGGAGSTRCGGDDVNDYTAGRVGSHQVRAERFLAKQTFLGAHRRAQWDWLAYLRNPPRFSAAAFAPVSASGPSSCNPLLWRITVFPATSRAAISSKPTDQGTTGVNFELHLPESYPFEAPRLWLHQDFFQPLRGIPGFWHEAPRPRESPNHVEIFVFPLNTWEPHLTVLDIMHGLESWLHHGLSSWQWRQMAFKADPIESPLHSSWPTRPVGPLKPNHLLALMGDDYYWVHMPPTFCPSLCNPPSTGTISHGKESKVRHRRRRRRKSAAASTVSNKREVTNALEDQYDLVINSLSNVELEPNFQQPQSTDRALGVEVHDPVDTRLPGDMEQGVSRWLAWNAMSIVLLTNPATAALVLTFLNGNSVLQFGAGSTAAWNTASWDKLWRFLCFNLSGPDLSTCMVRPGHSEVRFRRRSDWRRIYEVRSNGLNCEPRCSLTKIPAKSTVLGFRVTFSVHALSGKIDHLTTDFLLINEEAFRISNDRLSADTQGENRAIWLPAYLDQDHWGRARDVFMRNVAQLTGSQGPQRVTKAGLGILLQLVNTTSVLICDEGLDPTSLVLNGVFAVYRLMLALLVESPHILANAFRQLRDFCSDEAARGKKMCRSLGNQLCLATLLCSMDSKLPEVHQAPSAAYEIRWGSMFFLPALEESLARQVLWIGQTHPMTIKALEPDADLHPSGEGEDADWMEQEGGSLLGAAVTVEGGDLSKEEQKQMEDCFDGAKVNLRVMLFHALLRQVIRGGLEGAADVPAAVRRQLSTASGRRHLECVQADWDWFLTQLPRRAIAAWRRGLSEIFGIKNHSQFLQLLRETVPGVQYRLGPEFLNPRRVHLLLRSAVKTSLLRGYHNLHTDFTSIQASGVSNLLLRGKSFARICFVVDVSGSMGLRMPLPQLLDEATGPGKATTSIAVQDQGTFSRLQVAASQLNDAVRCHLKPKQVFNILTFDSSVRSWSEGPRQATQANVTSAVDFVKQLKPGGATNLTAALETAFNQPDISAIYLLTDGAPTVNYYGEEDLVNRVWCMSRWQGSLSTPTDQQGSSPTPIPVHATSLYGGEECKRLLTRITDVTGGELLAIETASDLGFLRETTAEPPVSMGL